jgi:hypothetical protein
MTLAQIRALTKTLATWLAATTSLLFAVSRFLPSGRPGGYSIVEDGWIQMLHMAFAERLQFGRDIVFTFGPWGFLFGGYHPATYLISVVVWVAIAFKRGGAPLSKAGCQCKLRMTSSFDSHPNNCARSGAK